MNEILGFYYCNCNFMIMSDICMFETNKIEYRCYLQINKYKYMDVYCCTISILQWYP